MSRSKKKRPYAGHSTSDSEKKDKQKTNRTLRRVNKVLLHEDRNEELKERRQVSDVWAYAKDGKARFNPRAKPGLMRK